jgi:lysophospholipase L1-like esterase
MGGLTSSNQWRDAGLMAKDRIHFSGEGYNLLGGLLFNALMDSFEDYLTKQVKN